MQFAAFSLARGHEIERDNYLSSLKTLPNRETVTKLAATERRSSTIGNWRQQAADYQRERDLHQKNNHSKYQYQLIWFSYFYFNTYIDELK